MLLFYLVFLIHYCCCIRANTDVTEHLPALYTLDDYASCLQGPGDVYCVVQAKVVGGNNQQLLNKIQNHSKISTNYNYYTIDRGVCVKKSCSRYIPHSPDTLDLRAVLHTCMHDNILKEYDVSTSLSGDYVCDKYGETQALSWKSWMVIFLLVVILVLNLAGTYYHIFNIKGKHKFTEVFSITTHWKDLTISTEERKNSKNGFLAGLQGIRGIMIFMVMFPHVWIVYSVFTSNPKNFEQTMAQNTFVKFITGSLSGVQIYFAMSGFLSAYNMEQQSEKRRLSLRYFPALFVHRWLRITVPYLLVLLVTVYLIPALGSGPLWKLYGEGMPNYCKKYFWHHLLFMNNYDEDNQCLLQTWHIAADMQVYVVGLFVYMAAPPPRRQLALLGLLAIGFIIPAYQIWKNNLDVAIITPELYRTLFSVTFRQFHIPGQNNLVCFTMGMICGITVYRWRRTPERDPPLGNTFWRVVQKTIIPIFIASLSSVQWFHFDAVSENVSRRMAFNTALHLMLGIISVLIFLSFTTKADCFPRRMVECRGLRFIGSLSYCIYLLHMNILYYMLGIRQHLVETSILKLVLIQFAVFPTSVILAVPMHLMLEAPACVLIKKLNTRLMLRLDKKEQ